MTITAARSTTSDHSTASSVTERSKKDPRVLDLDAATQRGLAEYQEFLDDTRKPDFPYDAVRPCCPRTGRTLGDQKAEAARHATRIRRSLAAERAREMTTLVQRRRAQPKLTPEEILDEKRRLMDGGGVRVVPLGITPWQAYLARSKRGRHVPMVA